MITSLSAGTLNATLPRQQELGENLITRYSEPHRRYHTTKHLLHVLTMIDQLADDHDVFWCSLLPGSDAVYDIRSARSEEERPPGWRCGS